MKQNKETVNETQGMIDKVCAGELLEGNNIITYSVTDIDNNTVTKKRTIVIKLDSNGDGIPDDDVTTSSE